MSTIKIRDLNIGIGPPKIIVSIIETNQDAIIRKAHVLKEMKVDIVEWRSDFYDDIYSISRVLDVLGHLRLVLGDMPLLFTFRTKMEGGEKGISIDKYTLLNKEVARSGSVDLIDIEMLSKEEDIVKENISNIKKADVLVVGSYHDLIQTPEKEKMIFCLRKMQAMGADILKLAVMANNPKDVIKLLDASYDMYTKYAECPLMTMSMGPIGSISRLTGVFGSSLTFGAVGQESAPGQIPLEELADILGIIHKYV